MIELKDLHAIIEETTQSLPGSVTAETDLAALDGWDSMGVVLFIDEIQSRAGVEVAVHDLRACSRSTDLLNLIQDLASK